MNKKTKLSLILTVIVLLAVLAGCAGGGRIISGLRAYTFTNLIYPNYKHQERWIEPDEYMTMDGQLLEEAWQDQNFLKIAGNGYSCSVATVFGDKGVYFGVKIDDRHIHVNPDRADWQNTGIELHIAPSGTDNREDAIMLRLNAGELSVLGMRGSYEADNINGYQWDWVPFYVKSHVDGELQEGLLSTNDAKGLTFEVLIPWEGLGMDGPGNVVCLPAYNHCKGYDEDAGRLREHIQYLGDMFTVSTWPEFTKKGSVVEPDADTDIIGDALVGGSKTAGWDLSQRPNGSIASVGGGVQEIWFRYPDADRYMIEVTVKNAKPVNDVWPAVGVILSDDHQGTGMRFQLFTGYDGKGQHHFKVYDLLRSEPPLANVNVLGTSGADTEAGCRLRIIRDGKDYYIYINGVFYYQGTSDELENAGIAGLYTVGMEAIFTDYSYSADIQLPGEEELPLVQPDKDTDLIGDSLLAMDKTLGWDLSRRDEGVLVSGSGIQEIWFRQEASTWYMVEATVSSAAPDNDVWPSVGVILSDDGMGRGIRMQLFTGYEGNGQHHFKVYDINRSEPPIHTVFLTNNSGADTVQGCKLKLVRYNQDFWIFVNDVLLYKGTSEQLVNAGVAGLYTIGMNAIFTDYRYTAQPEIPTEEVVTPAADNLQIIRPGWDTSRIEENVIVSSAGHQEVWFDVPEADRYVVKVRVSLARPYNDSWPSVGLLVGDDGKGKGVRISLFTGWQGNGGHHIKVYDLNFREPPLVPQIALPQDCAIGTEAGVELKIVRDGKNFSFYIDDVLIYSGESELLANTGFAGFYTVGCAAEFSDYSYEILN